jgi:hypothetical protein
MICKNWLKKYSGPRNSVIKARKNSLVWFLLICSKTPHSINFLYIQTNENGLAMHHNQNICKKMVMNNETSRKVTGLVSGLTLAFTY